MASDGYRVLQALGEFSESLVTIAVEFRHPRVRHVVPFTSVRAHPLARATAFGFSLGFSMPNHCEVNWGLVYTQSIDDGPRTLAVDVEVTGYLRGGGCHIETLAEWTVAADADLVEKLGAASAMIEASVYAFDFDAYSRLVPS